MINVYLFFMKTKTVIGGNTGQVLSYLLGGKFSEKTKWHGKLVEFLLTNTKTATYEMVVFALLSDYNVKLLCTYGKSESSISLHTMFASYFIANNSISIVLFPIFDPEKLCFYDRY